MNSEMCFAAVDPIRLNLLLGLTLPSLAFLALVFIGWSLDLAWKKWTSHRVRVTSRPRIIRHARVLIKGRKREFARSGDGRTVR